VVPFESLVRMPIRLL